MIKANKQHMHGFVDIKKHYATSNCPIYDMVIYPSSYRSSGRLYVMLKFEEVKKILEQGVFQPTPLSEALYNKKFKREEEH